MKKFVLHIWLVSILCAFMMFSHAIAAEMTLQEILDGITNGGTSSVNASTDFLPDSSDSYWNITASGHSVATLVIELAGFADQNTFGVYDISDPMKQVQLFSGAHSNGDAVMLSIWADGSVFVNFADTGIDFSSPSFGYYLNTPQNNTFFSDTDLNNDHMDHMLAFQGTGDWIQIPPYSSGVWTDNEFILAWEDLYGGSNYDYNDMVVIVESVLPRPVPEPASLLLFSSGLLGTALWGRKRFISCSRVKYL